MMNIGSDAAAWMLELGHRLRIPARGGSMHPHVRNGERLRIERACLTDIAVGDIVLYVADKKMVAHRAIAKGEDEQGAFLRIKGDATPYFDPPVRSEQILGRVVAIERGGNWAHMDRLDRRLLNRLYALISPYSPYSYAVLRPIWRGARRLLRFHRIGQRRLN